MTSSAPAALALSALASVLQVPITKAPRREVNTYNYFNGQYMLINNKNTCTHNKTMHILCSGWIQINWLKLSKAVILCMQFLPLSSLCAPLS